MTLAFKHLNVVRGNTQVLSDVTFSLRAHRFTVLLGKNGSGKSTLVSALNQMIPYQGEILLDGEPVALLSHRERAKRIAVLPQTLFRVPVLTKDLIAFGRNPYVDLAGRLSPLDKEIILQAAKDTGVVPLLDRFVHKLSGGECQKAYLAMILAQNTRTIVLDEPTTYMDMAYAKAFLQLLCTLKMQRKKTFLVIMHDLSHALEYADDVIILSEGKVVFAGTKQRCLKEEYIERTFSLQRYTTCNAQGEEKIFFA